MNDCWDDISDHSIQGGWERAYYEAEFLQGHCVKSVPSCYPVLEEGAGLEGWRSFSMFLSVSSPIYLLSSRGVP